jgi:subtilase family serine protease
MRLRNLQDIGEKFMRRAWGIVCTLLFATLCSAQPDRITGTIDSYRAVALNGSVYSQAQPQYDQGPVDAAMRLDYITIVMQPSAEQQADLERLLKRQQDPASPNYHRWLTPEQYADRFGLSQNDVERLTAWLRSQGFSIVQVARGRNWIAFSGTAVLVENMFHTQIHYFNVDGEQHFANATEISIPQVLDGIVAGFRGLNDFSLKPMGIQQRGPADLFPLISRPFYTDLNNTAFHFLAPDDIATIYDITPLYNAKIDGTGMKMVVVGQTDINTTDIDDFRSGFNLPQINLQQVQVGSSDPGTTSDLNEADLDLEWSSAVARNATILYVKTLIANGGVSASAQYAIDNNLAPVISMSYGLCEAQSGSLESELQQANAEGITFLASSGDEGAAGCDKGSATVATGGLAVVYPASSPEVTGVGGNEFNEGSGTFWNTNNGANGGSAISYIPETAWNDTAINGTLSASGGGASSCADPTCSAGFPKPFWQVGLGVPNDGVRDVPDVAMSASADHDGYIVCTGNSCANGIEAAVQGNSIFGGTSASTPVFAGIVVLLNQFVGGTGLGPINTRLYQLAQNPSNGVFHDVTTGNNIVPCAQGTPNCPTAAPFQFGYSAGPGYDQVTGLGSVDAHALVTNWGASTTTTLSSSSNPAPASSSVTFIATVTTSGSTAPTGKVTFNDGITAQGTGTIASGKATFSTSSLLVGGHSITAVYPGDTKNAQSTSAVLVETIINNTTGSATTTKVVANQGGVTYGTAATFTATVTPSSATKTVTFLDGPTPLGFATLNSGSAAFTTSTLTAGKHSITGLYSGDSTNKTSTSSAVPQTINQANSTTTLSLNPAAINVGGSVAMTVTVAPASGSGTPTGSVDFFVDGVPIRQPPAKLSNGAATFNYTASSLTAGNHSITADYQGDTNFLPSFSSAQTLGVQDFKVVASPTTVNISAPGQSGTTTLTITPLGGFNQTLSYSCGTLPSETTCMFASAGANSETLTITTTASSRLRESPFGHRGSVFYALLLPGLMGLVLPSGNRKRPWRSLLTLLVVLAALMLWMPACGGGGGGGITNPGTPTGSSTVTITASTSGSNALSHSVNITLSVQ